NGEERRPQAGLVAGCDRPGNPPEVTTTSDHLGRSTTMRRLTMVLALALAASPALAEPWTQPGRTGKPGAQAYDDFPEPWRPRFVQAWQEKLDQAKQALAKAEGETKGLEKKVREATDYQKTLTPDNYPTLTAKGLDARRRNAAHDLEKAQKDLE